MSKNPFKDSTKKTRRASADSFLDLGVVRQVDADSSHTVLVEILSTGGSSGPVVASASVPQHGDINVPEVGTLVVVGRVKGRRPVILGTLYGTDANVPSYNPGDRRIGHDSTQAQFKIDEDGTVHIDSESGQPVLINGSEPGGADTRTDVSDAGILVVEDVADINFGADLPVSDDGDGTVTVDVNRYTDEEAQDAVGTILSADFTYDDAGNAINMDPHVTDASAHHTRYTDAEAVSAVAAADDYVKNTGDVMSGGLEINGTASGASESSTNILIEDGVPQIEFHETGQSTVGHYWIHNNGGNLYILQDRNDDGSWDAPHPLRITPTGDIRFGHSIQDGSGNTMLQSVVATGQVTLSSGSAVVDTGISATDATFMLAVGVDDPNADTKIAGRLFWDDSAGTYKIEIVEQETAVGNPTVNYDVVRVR